MLKILLITFFTFATYSAMATTQAIFSKDGSKATVLMLAIATNPDAVSFNDLLNFAPQDNNGKAVKKFTFTDDKGIEALNVICAFSKLVLTTGSCTLTVSGASAVQFDSSHSTIEYRLQGAEAARMAEFFILPQQSGEVFRSTDNRLLLTVEYSGADVSGFVFQYGSF